jgi:hypothetical protein
LASLGIVLTILRLSSLTIALKKHSAQQIADMSRASLMSSSFVNQQMSVDQSQWNAAIVKSKDIHKAAAVAGATPSHPTPDGCEATVMIVRHCEKGQVTEHCAYVGFERSAYMATLFGNDHGERWPAPSYLFALAPSGRNKKTRMNFREIETVGPMAKKLGLTVNDKFEAADVSRLAMYIQNLLSSGNMCGKMALVSWHHTGISQLANRLGCGPTQGCPTEYREDTFDEVWQIKFTFRNLTHSVEDNLALPEQPQWYIFGSVQQQGFDPLAYSKQSGDYPAGGTEFGMRWKSLVTDIQERPKPVEGWSVVKKPDFLLPEDQH